MNQDALDILNKVFGYKEFRAPQDKIISDLIDGKNLSVIMPTGGGKSMCYQIPSMVREGVGVIISPLIALMDDQVQGLKQNGIKAHFINSTLSVDEKRIIKEDIENNNADVLYVSPELLLSNAFYGWIKNIKIALFAIDEAHCVSQWGHDFRREYLKLNCLAIDFPDIPRIALTATANEITRNEILSNLSIEKENQHIAGFDRSNISYHIESKGDDEKDQLLNYIRRNHSDETGIVYCISRKKTEEVAKYLRKRGLNAYHYHAGLTTDEKSERLRLFLNEDNIIIVATIAFGMGIDKPNVRFVCHVDIPSSIEAYYQETGRAGRDGNPSDAWMLFGVQDVFTRQKMVDKSNADQQHKQIEQNALDAIFSLCETSHCRREVLIGYFTDQIIKDCGNCDNCLNPPETIDATIIAQKVFSTLLKTKQSFGVYHTIDVLRGVENAKILENNHNELSVFGIGKDYSKSDWKTIFRQLIVLGYIKIDPFSNHLWLNEKSLPLLKGLEKLKLNKQIVNKQSINRGYSKDNIKNSFTSGEQMLFKNLQELRLTLSRKLNVPPYLIFNDNELFSLVIRKPLNERDMLRIEGVSSGKMTKFGFQFLDIIKESEM